MKEKLELPKLFLLYLNDIALIVNIMQSLERVNSADNITITFS